MVRAINKITTRVKYCTKCVNSNLRPRLTFDNKGVCDACQYAFKKHNSINWKEREKLLKELCDKYRSKDGSHDVLVPTSGGKDSCFVAHRLKYDFKMNPLCVSWAPAIYTEIGWQNLKKFSNFFDTIIYIPNREVHSKLTRIAFEEFGDPFQPWHYGQQSYPLQIAMKHNIKFIMYGENQDAEYGGGKKKQLKAEETLAERYENQRYRVKKGVDTLLEIGIRKKILNKNLKKNKYLDDYRLPKISEVKNSKIKTYFFSYFTKWIPQHNYYYAQKHLNFKTGLSRSQGTFTSYTSLDDKLDELYYFMQYIKFGFGRATSEASIDVRDGFISRKEAVNLVKLYDGEFPDQDLNEVLDYMNIGKKEFFKIVDKFRSKKLWSKTGKKWKLKHIVY